MNSNLNNDSSNILPEEAGYKRLTEAVFADPVKQEALEATIAALKSGNEDPKAFYIKDVVGEFAPNIKFELRHKDGFTPQNMRGNRSNKDRIAVYNPTSKKVDFQFWQ